jgi:hypothetical protein
MCAASARTIIATPVAVVTTTDTLTLTTGKQLRSGNPQLPLNPPTLASVLIIFTWDASKIVVTTRLLTRWC